MSRDRAVGAARVLVAGSAALVALVACSGSSGTASAPTHSPASRPPATSGATASPGTPPAGRWQVLPGMPPVLDPSNIYAADAPGNISPVARHDRPLIYVPNSESNTVSVINPRTYKVIATHRVGALPQHVTPSWDLRTLYVLNDEGNSVTPINPANGRFGKPIPVADPYNMYFTPNGRYAIVVAERLNRLDFVNPHTMKLRHALPVHCQGVDHADFSANGRYAIFSCEFSSKLVKIDIQAQKVVGHLSLPKRRGAAMPMPQDVKLSPDGKTFYVADMASNGVWMINGRTLKVIGFRATGKGAHGLYASRNSKYLYVSNRDEGSVSLINLATTKIVRKWRIGGSPDMGGVSANGKVLWLSGRYDSVVYAINTRTGHRIATIPVGGGPHGLCVYPQPGRYSLGHTGVFR
ncbi:MAG: beta-propeller fold lactonase family protein [Frankiaceae bacterium]|nr:beta-propeller fold lactonase family protein [Frankiaceae bacterium]